MNECKGDTTDTKHRRNRYQQPLPKVSEDGDQRMTHSIDLRSLHTIHDRFTLSTNLLPDTKAPRCKRHELSAPRFQDLLDKTEESQPHHLPIVFAALGSMGVVSREAFQSESAPANHPLRDFYRSHSFVRPRFDSSEADKKDL